jgi:transposase
MTRADDSLPDDVATLKAMLVAERTARTAAEAQAKAGTLMIEKLKLAIAKLRHDRFGASSERSTRLIEQLKLQLADLEETAAEAEVVAENTVPPAGTIPIHGFQRRKPSRRPLPEHLPRERVVYPAPATCAFCGGGTPRKIGEDVTETLEVVPRQWKVIQHVREKFSCRACEAITQPPAPSHPIARGRAGSALLRAQVRYRRRRMPTGRLRPNNSVLTGAADERQHPRAKHGMRAPGSDRRIS